MLVYVRPTDGEEVSCPYIEGRKFRQRYSILSDLDGEEVDYLLLNGWRHFGNYFFMPNCRECSACTPIRTLVTEFKPSKSQRKNFNKNNTLITVEFSPLFFSDEIFNLYTKHSRVKFGQETSMDEFKSSFFSDALSGNSRLSLFRIDGKLIGVGFIDITATGLSSIYFCYDTDYSSYGLGVFSVLKEIEYAAELGKQYYYLGYYIEENSSMEYKNRYTPYETLLWEEGQWRKPKQKSTV